MPRKLLGSARRILGKIKKKSFRANSADWFCGDLIKIPRSEGRAADHVSFDDLEGALGYIREKAREFPWILVPQEVEAAREQKHCYPLIYHRGECVGYVKIALRQAYVEDFSDILVLGDDEAFVCDTFIDPAFRGKGLSRSLLAEAMEYLRQRGVRFLFCHIPSWNAASIGLYTGFGFRRIDTIRHHRLMGHGFYSRRPAEVIAEGRKMAEGGEKGRGEHCRMERVSGGVR